MWTKLFKDQAGQSTSPKLQLKDGSQARQARPNLRLGETLLLTGSDTSCTNCSQISRFSKKDGGKR